MPIKGEVLVTKHNLCRRIKADDMEQYTKNIFHIGCYVNIKVCSMIIMDDVLPVLLVPP